MQIQYHDKINCLFTPPDGAVQGFFVTFSVEEEVDKDGDIGKRNQQSTAKI